MQLLRNQFMDDSSVRTWIRDQSEQSRFFFTWDEIRKSFPLKPTSTLRSALRTASKARLISSAWQGFYLILPPTYAKQRTLPVPMYLDALMKYLHRPYCVALLNAAAFYGSAHQSPQAFCVMTSLPIPRSRTKDGTILEFVGKREFNNGIPPELIREFKTPSGYIKVSSLELTALTLIQYSKRMGGLSRALTVMEELIGECHFELMPESILSSIPLPCFQRLGYIVESLLGEKEQGEAIHRFIDAHHLNFQKTLFSLESTEKTGNFNKRWMLVINDQLESDLS